MLSSRVMSDFRIRRSTLFSLRWHRERWPDRFAPGDIWLDGDKYRMIRLRHHAMHFQGDNCGEWSAATFRQTGEPLASERSYFSTADEALAWAIDPAHDIKFIFRFAY